jgi:hypothetical protein
MCHDPFFSVHGHLAISTALVILRQFAQGRHRIVGKLWWCGDMAQRSPAVVTMGTGSYAFESGLAHRALPQFLE